MLNNSLKNVFMQEWLKFAASTIQICLIIAMALAYLLLKVSIILASVILNVAADT